MAAPLSLPDPRDERLEHSPLQLVVCQVRHDRLAAVADPARALKIHAALAEDFPTLDESFEQSITLATGPAGFATDRAEPERGWRFRSADDSWTISLAHSYFAIETSAYGRWEDFKTKLSRLSQTVAEFLAPSIEHRLGLRMVDQIQHPSVTSPTGFRGLIADELLGPLSGGALASSVRSTQSLVQLQGPDGLTVNLRHGCQVSGESVTYLLDHDCFRQASQPFEVQGILDTAELLHRLATQVFQSVISDSLYEYLRGGSR